MHSELHYCFLQMASSLIVNRQTLDKLVQNAPNIGLASTTLSTCKELPPPLDPKDYRQVRFWTLKSFEAYHNDLAGETDGLATHQKRRGRCRKSEDNEGRYPYLENKDGSAVSREILVKVGQRARRLWQSMNAVGHAPPSWGKASENAYIYFNSKMLNEPKFIFFRFCKGNWKITRWATKAYPSWAHNHMKSSNAGHSKTPHSNKRKREDLDDPSLIQIDDDQNESIPSTNSPIENNSDALASPTPSGPASVPIAVCSHESLRCRAEHHRILATNDDTSRSPVREIAEYSNCSDSPDSDGLYDEVDRSSTCGTTNSTTTPRGNPTGLTTSSLSTSMTIAPSSSIPMSASSAPMMITPSSSNPMSSTSAPATTMSLSSTLTTITSSVSTLSRSAPPPASVNDETAGQGQSSAKRMKGQAIVGKGLTDKYFRPQHVQTLKTNIFTGISA